MKKHFSSFLLILIMMSSCSSYKDKRSENFVLNGIINGQDSGKLVLSYYSDTVYISDTAEVSYGNFDFSGKISEPTKAYLKDGNNLDWATIFLEPGKLKVSLSKDRFSELKMTGSKTQEELVFLNAMEKLINDKLMILRKQQLKISDSIKKLSSGPAKLILEKQSEDTQSQWTATRAGLDSVWLKFVVEHPKSFVTPSYLYMLEANEVISLDTLKSIFSGLDKSIRESIDGKNISEDIRKKENIRIGSQAPDFKARDLNQQIVTMSQFKEKNVVLMDFWASWCTPCRESVPHLKSLYKKYHAKGLEIIAVSVDTNKESWINAVSQDSTGMWFHVPVAEQYIKGPSYVTIDDIYKNYFVQAIPATIVIDKNGKIVSRSVGTSEENEKSLDNILAQIFNE